MTMGYREIYERYRQNILAGVIKPGDKLPSIRVLAEELHVARKTVEAAYAVLVGEGYLVSRGAKGTLVNPDLVIPSPRPDMAPDSEDATLNQFLDLRDAPGAMRLGIPALDAFPTKKWLLLAGKAARSLRPNDMTNPPVMGYTPLREAIASYVNISRGLNCTADQVFITSGYRSNLMLILHALGMKSDKVVFEDPGYFFGQLSEHPRCITRPWIGRVSMWITCCAIILMPALPSSRRRITARSPSRSPCRASINCWNGRRGTRAGLWKMITMANSTTPAKCCLR